MQVEYGLRQSVVDGWRSVVGGLRETIDRVFVGLLKPLQVGFGALDALLDQGLLLFGADVEVGGADVKGIDVDGALPVIAFQVLFFLRVHHRGEQGFGVVAEALDGLAARWLVVAKQADLALGVQA